MIARYLHGLALYFVALLPAVSVQAAPPVLEPSSPWVVNYADDSCRLAREFGQGEQKVTFVADLFAPNDRLDIMLVGRVLDSGTHPTVKSGFGPGLPLNEGKRVYAGVIGDDHVPVMMLGTHDLLNRSNPKPDQPLPSPTPDDIGRISDFTMAMGQQIVLLHLGPLKGAMAALQTCTQELVRLWGLDPVEQANLAVPLRPNGRPGEWVTARDYPGGPLRQRLSGTVWFRLMVDATGQPRSCYVQQASKAPEFAALTCKLLMARARFTPARDATGEPKASYYTNRVNFSIDQ